AITEAANTCCFFSRKLVVVDDLDFNELKEDDSLLAYCRNPNPSTCLVLIAERINRGSKLYKEITGIGGIYEFNYPKSLSEWQNWVQQQAKLRGKNINPATAKFFVEWSGHQSGILCQELDKLAVYTGDRQNISQDDIRQVCVPMAENSIFSMIDAIAANKAADALRELRAVLNQEPYLKVFTKIVRQVRLLLAATIMRKKGEPVERFMEVCGIRSPYEGKKIYRQAANFTPVRLVRVMEDCLKTDIALKSSGGNPHFLLELMIIHFCSG
ncbi:MAG: DNA polymerase III subunit delta, partial [Peptococcaceae bacterium]|nr:DNA polymerase III subunit delta [Peptococcaceae bacterium]